MELKEKLTEKSSKLQATKSSKTGVLRESGNRAEDNYVCPDFVRPAPPPRRIVSAKVGTRTTALRAVQPSATVKPNIAAKPIVSTNLNVADEGRRVGTVERPRVTIASRGRAEKGGKTKEGTHSDVYGQERTIRYQFIKK